MIKTTSNTLNDLTEESFENYILYDKKLTSNKSALYALKNRFRILKKHFNEIEFNRSNFVQFLSLENKRGINQSTLNKYISCVKHIAHMRNITEFDDMSYFKESKKEVDTLTWNEMRDLAEVEVDYRLSKGGLTKEEQNNRMWCYITLMSEVGCRKSEALNLLWKDVYSDRVTFRNTKNGDDRTVPITRKLHARLMSLPRIENKVFALSDLNNFVTLDLKRRADLVGIKKPIYNHVIRHSVATYLLGSKAPLKLVCNILGWKDPKTADRYDQSGISEMEELLSTYSRIFRQHMEYDTLVDKVKDFLERIIDIEVAKLQYSQSGDRIEITITKNASDST